MISKFHVHQASLDLINDKIISLQLVLEDLKQTGAGETKNTAGDKHETALAMVQIEQANKRQQLHRLLEQKEILIKIDSTSKHRKAGTGSLLKTDKGYFYIATSLGKIMISDVSVFVLSAQSPLGEKLMHTSVGDSIVMNENTYLVEKIE